MLLRAAVQFQVGGSFSALRDPQGGSVVCSSAGLRHTCACQLIWRRSTRPHREASLRKKRGPGDAGHRSRRWVLLCATATVGGRPAHGLPSHTHPRVLHDLRRASYQNRASASEGVVAKSLAGATTAGTQGQRAAPGQKHCLARKRNRVVTAPPRPCCRPWRPPKKAFCVDG